MTRLHAFLGFAAAIAAPVTSLVFPATTGAQDLPFYYPAPPPETVKLTRAVAYGSAESVTLHMDVYQPATGSGAPALVIYGHMDPATGESNRTSNTNAAMWARIAAANGIVAIIPDIRGTSGSASGPGQPIGNDFRTLLTYLKGNAAQHGIDSDRIAVFAASGGTWPAFAAVMDTANREVKAAVMLYGHGTIETLRRDLPVLYVRAGRDGRTMNDGFNRLAALALAQNAPITIVNHSIGLHGFETRNDDAATRLVIDQVLEFVKRSTAHDYQRAIRGQR
jgi:dienelactone hydrolase